MSDSSVIIFSTALISLGCWLLSTIYIYIIYKFFSAKIQRSVTPQQSCKYRSLYRWLSYFQHVIYLLPVIFISPAVADEWFYSYGQPVSPIIGVYIAMIAVVFYIVLMQSNTAYSPYSKISSITKTAIKDDNYMLFLRGFDTDNYISEQYLELKSAKDLFSEHRFVQRLSFVMTTYAVGRPEELVSPSGASRVYLDNATWLADVETMMSKSKCTIILVNSKCNCLLEIERSIKFKEKVIYIINDKKHYKNAIESVPEFKELDTIPSCDHFIIYEENGDRKTMAFQNTNKSYWDIINVIRSVSSC